MVERALELDNVRAGYGETVVLEDMRLALGASETVSIIGRNGVGKTTLLATIMGHTTLHGGRVSLHGKDISRLATYRRVTAGLGYVPQEREIFPSLTVRENLEVAARAGPWSIATVFELFPRLSERAENRGNQLSGGEQQMLAIGRALIGNPTVLLMDEPSEGLAPVIVEELARAVTSSPRLTAREQQTSLPPENGDAPIGTRHVGCIAANGTKISPEMGSTDTEWSPGVVLRICVIKSVAASIITSSGWFPPAISDYYCPRLETTYSWSGRTTLDLCH